MIISVYVSKYSIGKFVNYVCVICTRIYFKQKFLPFELMFSISFVSISEHSDDKKAYK